MSFRVEAATGRRQLEGPQQRVRLLEVRPAGHNFVDEVLDTHDAELAERRLDVLIALDGHPHSVDLNVSALVDHIGDGLAVEVAVGDVGLDATEHADGGLVELDEGSVVQLPETHELEDLAGLGGQFIDTLDADGEGHARLSFHVELVVGASLSLRVDESSLLLLVLLEVLGGVGDVLLALVGALLLLLLFAVFLGLGELLVAIQLLLHVLRHHPA